MKYKGVIFDLDGVITDTSEYHYIAWKYLAQQIDIEIDRKFNESLKGISRKESLENILIKGNKQNIYTENKKLEFMQMKNEYYLKLLDKLTPENILDDIKETLVYLRELDIKIGLASASKNAKYILEKLEIIDLFDEIVDVEYIKVGKPNPEIFIEGARLLNLDCKECIGVEDSFAGITAINEANMKSIGVGNKDDLPYADIIIPSTNELKNTIESLL